MLPAVVARPCGSAARSRLPQQRAALDPGAAALRVDPDRVHRRQVDHQPAVGHRQPDDAVAAALHADLQAGLAAEPDGGHDVVGRRAARDQRRPPVDDGVPDLAMRVVTVVAGPDQLTGEPGMVVLEAVIGASDAAGVGRSHDRGPAHSM